MFDLTLFTETRSFFLFFGPRVALYVHQRKTKQFIAMLITQPIVSFSRIHLCQLPGRKPSPGGSKEVSSPCSDRVDSSHIFPPSQDGRLGLCVGGTARGRHLSVVDQSVAVFLYSCLNRHRTTVIAVTPIIIAS